jgi:hypothetical protein
MYEYVTGIGKKLNISTPFGIKFTDIKSETTVKDDCVVHKSEYPNGFYIEVAQYSDKIVLLSNRELINNGDGTFTAPEE